MRRMFWLALALVLLLAGCGLGETELYGEVMQAQVEGGRLSGFVLRTEEGEDVTVSLSENTQILSWIDEVDEEAFLAGEAENIQVTVTALRDGEGYRAREITLRSLLVWEEMLTLSDGTEVEVWINGGDNSYRLSDGTELLRENRPSGPQNVHVGGVEGFDQLSAPAREAVASYYAEQGLLYNVEEVLERAYAEYKDGGEDFSAYLVEQSVSPSASNERLMYFTTTVFCSIDSGTAEETSLPAVFDRETGEKLDIWSLFAVPEEEARAALVDKMAEGGYIPRAELEAALRPEYIIFRTDRLNLTFPKGTLPSQEYTTGGSFDYEELDGLLQPWAIPEEPEQEQ